MNGSRHWGLLLIVVVLFAAALIPSLSSRRVTGVAQPAPVPGPPAVGDCVTDAIDPAWNNFGILPVTPGTATSTYSYPQVGINPCAGSRYGEITAVIANPVKPVITTSDTAAENSTEVSDSNMDTCQSAGYRYAGIVLVGNGIAPPAPEWSTPLNFETAASTPSVRQQAAGQHWLACIVYLHGLDDRPFAEQERYDTSIRNALVTGQESNRTGICVTGPDLLDNAAGCGADHQGEIFGFGGVFEGHPVARAALQRTCFQVVMRLTGIPDVAAVGLAVQVLTTGMNDAPIADATITASASLTCGVVSTHHRTLVGSLRGLGSRPIPWK